MAGAASIEKLDRLFLKTHSLDTARACETFDALAGILDEFNLVLDDWRLRWLRRILARAEVERTGPEADLFSQREPYAESLSPEDIDALTGLTA